MLLSAFPRLDLPFALESCRKRSASLLIDQCDRSASSRVSGPFTAIVLLKSFRNIDTHTRVVAAVAALRDIDERRPGRFLHTMEYRFSEFDKVHLVVGTTNLPVIEQGYYTRL